MDLEGFYLLAKKYVIEQGFNYEIDFVEERRFEDVIEEEFFKEYMYVVINAGLRNQVAEVMVRRVLRNGLTAMAHKGKRKAIEEGIKRSGDWFVALNSLDTTEQILDFLELLPWIGPVTKYHLARNLGIDVAKPDRHLKRVARHFGFFKKVDHPIGQNLYIKAINCKEDVQGLCEELSEKTGDRIGTVDVVIWRFLNLNPSYWKDIDKGKSCVTKEIQ